MQKETISKENLKNIKKKNKKVTKLKARKNMEIGHWTKSCTLQVLKI